MALVATVPAILVLIAASVTFAQQPAQPPPRLQPVPFDQAALDRWLVVFQDVAPQLAANANLSDQQVDGIYDRACKKARFTDIGQCRALDDYLGAITAGISDDGTKFIDPVARARQDLATLAADRTLTAKQKAEQRAEIEGYLATMPERIPPEHIALLNRNAARLLPLLQQSQAPPPKR
jgi:hypothetical protein